MLRGVAQVVAHLTGGQGVASSSLVTPTKIQGILLDTLYFAYRQDLKRNTACRRNRGEKREKQSGGLLRC